MDINVKDLIEHIKEESKKELHIALSDKRMSIHNKIIESQSFEYFLRNIYTYANDKAEVLQFLKIANTLREEFNFEFDEMNSKDVQELFNFYLCSVYRFSRCDKNIVENCDNETVDLESCDDDKYTKEETKVFEKNEEIKVRPSNFLQESLCGILRLGGGTLGEMWRVSKRLRSSDHYNMKTKILYQNVYRLCFKISLDDEEKEQQLPIELKQQDRGGMFFPKESLRDFVKEVNNTVRLFANSDALSEHGKDMIKVCVSEVKENQKIERLFWEGVECIPDLLTQFDRESLTFFYKIWLRKLTHARIQEFISVCSGSISKGGHNLRDNLYSQLKKLYAKTKTVKKNSKETKGAKKEEKVKIGKRKRKSPEKLDNQECTTKAPKLNQRKAPKINKTEVSKKAEKKTPKVAVDKKAGKKNPKVAVNKKAEKKNPKVAVNKKTEKKTGNPSISKTKPKCNKSQPSHLYEVQERVSLKTNGLTCDQNSPKKISVIHLKSIKLF